METTTERLRAAALVCAAAICWNLGGLFVRLIGDHLDSWTIAFWRSAFMVLSVGGWLFGSNGLKVLGVYRAMSWTGVASGLLLAGSFIMFILAITRTSVANAVVLQSAAPLASALLGRVFRDAWHLVRGQKLICKLCNVGCSLMISARPLRGNSCRLHPYQLTASC